MSFGKRLKKARTAKKLTQSEVADKLGIDDTTVSKYENDRSEPDNETLTKLADLYEIKIDYLHGRVTNEEALEDDSQLEKDRKYALDLLMAIHDPAEWEKAISYLRFLAGEQKE